MMYDNHDVLFMAFAMAIMSVQHRCDLQRRRFFVHYCDTILITRMIHATSLATTSYVIWLLCHKINYGAMLSQKFWQRFPDPGPRSVWMDLTESPEFVFPIRPTVASSSRWDEPKMSTDHKLKCSFYALTISNFLLCALLSRYVLQQLPVDIRLSVRLSVCLLHVCTLPGCFDT